MTSKHSNGQTQKPGQAVLMNPGPNAYQTAIEMHETRSHRHRNGRKNHPKMISFIQVNQ